MKKDLNFFAPFKILISLSLFLCLAGIGLIGAIGFEYSTDFKGGVESFVEFENEPTLEELLQKLADLGIESEVQKVLSQKNTFIIRVLPEGVNAGFLSEHGLLTGKDPLDTGNQETEDPSPAGSADEATADVPSRDISVNAEEQASNAAEVVSLANDPAALVRRSLFTALSLLYSSDEFSIRQTRIIGSVLSAENRRNAFLTCLIVIALIVAYLSMRFRFPFALAAIIAVIHDVLIMLLCVILFNIEFSILTMVAILTTFGYSVNDTIILLDRVREEQGNYKLSNYKALLNLAINRIIGRSIITSLTTLTVVLALYFATTAAYKDFAFILVIGLISGTYSSIYVATGVLLAWHKKRPLLETK